MHKRRRFGEQIRVRLPAEEAGAGTMDRRLEEAEVPYYDCASNRRSGRFEGFVRGILGGSSSLEVERVVWCPGAMPEMLTIGEAARRSGVAASALRYYEERSLISAERLPGGSRVYPRAVVRRIAFIVFAQRVGLSLEEIGEELSKLPSSRTPDRKDWTRLTASWSDRIDLRIADLQRLKAGLTECIGCGCLSLDRCALANPGDRAARLGSGPRYLMGDPSPVGPLK